MFKQIHDNKFNAKCFIRHLKQNTFCSFSNTFVFQKGAVGVWAYSTPCSILGNLSSQVSEDGDLVTSAAYAKWIFSSDRLCSKPQNYFETRNIEVICTTRFYSKMNFNLAKYLVFAQQQNVERVAENKNDVFAVPRFVMM